MYGPLQAGDFLLPPRKKDLPCLHCNDEGESVIKHGHYSSEVVRQMAVDLGRNDYFCPGCKKLHTTALPRRHKLVMASSTVHNAITHLNITPGFHMSVETIPGAKTPDLERAFRKLWFTKPEPIDCVLICGINQVTTESVDDMMQSYGNIIQAFKDHSTAHSLLNPSTINIATVIMPPKYCDFRKSCNPRHFTKLDPNYKNYRVKIDEINRQIILLNEAEGISSGFRCDSYGIRICERKKVREHKFSHWIEADDLKKLHLTHDKRADMLHKLQFYFINNTDW